MLVSDVVVLHSLSDFVIIASISIGALSFRFNLMQRIYFYYAALSGFFGLFFLMMAWHTVLAPSSRFPTAMLLIVSAGPLLLPFKGLLNRDLKSCTWMSYLSLPYFIHGVTEAYVNQDQRPYALLEILFSLLLCFGAGFYVYKAEKA